jgi:hypothetical protein
MEDEDCFRAFLGRFLDCSENGAEGKVSGDVFFIMVKNDNGQK